VNTEKADQLLKEIGGYFYIETSAKLGTNIELVIFWVKLVIRKSGQNNVQEVHFKRGVPIAGQAQFGYWN
jgi:hypothetical protein